MEARWSSLVLYAAAATLLADVLPVASGTNATTLRQHALRIAERVEGELGKEQSSFIDGTLRPLFERRYRGLANDNPANNGQSAAA